MLRFRLPGAGFDEVFVFNGDMVSEVADAPSASDVNAVEDLDQG